MGSWGSSLGVWDPGMGVVCVGGGVVAGCMAVAELVCIAVS